MDRGSVVKNLDPSIRRFAHRLGTELGAERVLLLGPYAMGYPSWDSDYELVIIADRYGSIRPQDRTHDLHGMFYAEGGHAPLTLLCLSPEEFARMWPGGIPSERDHPEAIDLLQLEQAPA